MLLRLATLIITAFFFISSAHAGDGDEKSESDLKQAALDALADGSPTCTEERDTCVGLDVYIAFNEDGTPVVDAEWLKGHIAATHHHFEPISVSFEIASIHALPEKYTEIDTRKQRNRLGRKGYAEGTLQIYIVKRLANVDEPGDIWGVHWRDRGEMEHSWVIVSSVAWANTLSHEIGHFLSLPHSEYAISIMNKSARAEPPPGERTFHKKELKKMRKDLKSKLKSKRIVHRAD